MNTIEPLTFFYNTKQPRNNQGIHEAMRRFIRAKNAKGETVVLKKNGRLKGGEIHHIDHARSNGHQDNLFVCESNQQHTNLHNQTYQYVIESIQSGALVFDLDNKKYFVANPELNKYLSDWRKEGRPMRHQYENFHRHNGNELAKKRPTQGGLSFT
jgi:hypothetical protein